MNYDLNQAPVGKGKKMAPLASLKKLLTIIGGERSNLIKALTAILLNAALTLSGPFLLGYTIDKYIQTKNFHGVLLFSGIMLAVYLMAYLVNYAQMRMMGGIGQRCSSACAIRSSPNCRSYRSNFSTRTKPGT